MFPKGSKDKQINQNTQKYSTKYDADCRGNIFKNIMILSRKSEKRKVFILKEKDVRLAVKSMSIDSEVSFLRIQFTENVKSMPRNLTSDPRHIF